MADVLTSENVTGYYSIHLLSINLQRIIILF
jgi:hypothetical protein